jgi:hypothetical protein
MRRRLRIPLAVLAIALVVLSGGCRASGPPEPSPNTPSSTGLIEAPKEFDGSDVTFTGEVIGEAMRRGEMAWLHINDDAYYLKNVEEGAHLGGYNGGMAVWLPSHETDEIAHYGDYKHEGDIVTVNGVFNAACAEHGGDMDIHATGLEIKQVGRLVVDPIPPSKLAWAVGLGLLALVLYLLNRYWDRMTGGLGD